MRKKFALVCREEHKELAERAANFLCLHVDVEVQVNRYCPEGRVLLIDLSVLDLTNLWAGATN